MIELVFVLLHYHQNSLVDTFECVESILALDNQKNIRTIIVNNGSKDDSEGKLEHIFGQDNRIILINSNTNLGFAKGNNLGVKVAIEKFDPKFIAIFNNDTLVCQKNFLALIENEYKLNKFNVLGPKITTKTGQLQNPMFRNLKNLDDVEHLINAKKKLLDEYKKPISRFLLILRIKTVVKKMPIIKNIIKLLKHNKNKVNNIDYINRQFQVMLHGSALIFSKKHIDKYKFAFYPDTFLYVEENILDYIIRRDRLVSVYSPFIEVYHKEDVSTNSIVRNKKKKLFLLEHSLNSLNVFKDLLIEDLKTNK